MSMRQDKRHRCSWPARVAITRRTFCAATCLGVLVPAVQACNSPTAPSLEDNPIPSANAAIVNGALALTIDATSPLASPGGAVLIENGLGKFLVARIGHDTFLAVTGVCTHFGCTITRYADQIYECPCHGSRFSASGIVVRGPASSPLRAHQTRLAGDVLTITV